MSEFKMPELPESLRGFWNTVYSAGQMQAHTQLAVQQMREACAKECDRLTHALDNAGVSYHRPADAARCSRAIRSIQVGGEK